jgi:DNA polymerase
MARALGHPRVSLAALAEHYGLGVKGTEVVNALGKRRLDFTPYDLKAYGAYCCNDTQLTYDLFNVLREGFPVNELKLIDLTIRMFTEPVLELDGEKLADHYNTVVRAKELLLVSAMEDKHDIMRNDYLAAKLKSYGVVPPTKISPTTGKEVYAFAKTDQDFTDLSEHPDLRVQTIVAARLGVKSTLEETRTARFIDISNRGSLPIPLRYYAARTGRWGGEDKINLQNLPRGSSLKDAIKAPPGHVIIDCDSSQIEARTLAWLAEQNDLVEAFDAGEDVYKIMAASIYNKPEDKVTKDERFLGKTAVLGCGYGLGAIKFKSQLANFGKDVPLDECKRIVSVYRETYPKIPELWTAAGEALRAMMEGTVITLGRDGVLSIEGENGIRLPNGLYLRYPNLRWIELNPGEKPNFVYDDKRGRSTVPVRIYGGKLVENVTQGLARIIVGEQMLLIAKKYKPVMTVHDAIAVVVPEGEAKIARENVELFMRTRPSWALELPLNCESGVGATYGACK